MNAHLNRCKTIFWKVREINSEAAKNEEQLRTGIKV